MTLAAYLAAFYMLGPWADVQADLVAATVREVAQGSSIVINAKVCGGGIEMQGDNAMLYDTFIDGDCKPDAAVKIK
jgi:hypothetical protein